MLTTLVYSKEGESVDSIFDPSPAKQCDNTDRDRSIEQQLLDGTVDPQARAIA
jgi:hypothetical protein